MRIAFISDIHANLEALESVLADIDKNGVDEICCLGDVVGYGASPNECVQLVSERCGSVLMGNHDAVATGLFTTHHFNIHAKAAIEWTTENLTLSSRDYLAVRPLSRIADLLTMVHATPYEPGMWYYITSLEEAVFNFQFFDTKICFVGHTHVPMIIVLDDEEIYVNRDNNMSFGDRGSLRMMINVGSVGQPRDRNPLSSYGILDTSEKRFTLRRVEYDIAGTQARMKEIKMPDFLINRLAEGR